MIGRFDLGDGRKRVEKSDLGILQGSKGSNDERQRFLIGLGKIIRQQNPLSIHGSPPFPGSMDQNMAEIDGRRQISAPAGLLSRRLRWRSSEALPAPGKDMGGARAYRLKTAGLEVDMRRMPRIRKHGNHHS
jgi:hypothetical protein